MSEDLCTPRRSQMQSRGMRWSFLNCMYGNSVILSFGRRLLIPKECTLYTLLCYAPRNASRMKIWSIRLINDVKQSLVEPTVYYSTIFCMNHTFTVDYITLIGITIRTRVSKESSPPRGVTTNRTMTSVWVLLWRVDYDTMSLWRLSTLYMTIAALVKLILKR